METKRDIRKRINFIIDILIIVSFVWYFICLQFNLFDCDHEGWSSGLKFFKYFTNIGNSLLVASSLINIIYYLVKKQTGEAFYCLRLAAVTSTTIIFLVTYFALAIIQGWQLCFKLPAYLFEHTILPILALFQVLIFDKKMKVNKTKTIFGTIPVMTYSLIWIIVLLILNLPSETETDLSVVPYFFLAIHNQNAFLTILYEFIAFGVSFGICLLLIIINNKLIDKNLIYNNEKGI